MLIRKLSLSIFFSTLYRFKPIPARNTFRKGNSQNGLDVAEMNKLLMKKVEELILRDRERAKGQGERKADYGITGGDGDVE